MSRLRLCWNEKVRLLTREEASSTNWFDVDEEGTETLRLMCKEGNARFGEGSHWIELTDSPSIRLVTSYHPEARASVPWSQAKGRLTAK
jgi:hypothetical protein